MFSTFRKEAADVTDLNSVDVLVSKLVTTTTLPGQLSHLWSEVISFLTLNDLVAFLAAKAEESTLFLAHQIRISSLTSSV